MMTPRVDTQAAVSDEYSAAMTGGPIKYRAGFHDVVAKWNHSPFHEFIVISTSSAPLPPLRRIRSDGVGPDFATRTPAAPLGVPVGPAVVVVGQQVQFTLP